MAQIAELLMWKRVRDAITGRFVNRAQAEARPQTTVTEVVKQVTTHRRTGMTTISMASNAVDSVDPTRNRVSYDSEGYNGAKRCLYQRCFAPWVIDQTQRPGPTFPTGMGISEEGRLTPLDKATGDGSYTYRNGTNPGSNSPYVEIVQAWIALESDPLTPISNVLQFSV